MTTFKCPPSCGYDDGEGDISEWVSVKDGLPPHNYSSRILAYGTPTCGTCGTEVRIEFCVFTTEDGFQFGQFNCGFEASHWMPLPSPPHHN